MQMYIHRNVWLESKCLRRYVRHVAKSKHTEAKLPSQAPDSLRLAPTTDKFLSGATEH